MAYAFQELIVENGQAAAGGGDAPGSVRVRNTIRRFLVPGATPALVALNTELNNEAGPGAQYPGIPGLVSIGHTVGGRVGPDSTGDIAHYVETQYAPSGTPQFDFPSPDRQNLAFVSAGFAPFEKTIDFPIYVERTIAAPNPLGSEQTSKQWVKVENKTIVVKCLAFQIEFNTTTLSASEIGAIYLQTNKLHTFYGGQWLFKPQRADKIFRDGVWNVVYRWESDPGTSANDLQEFDSDPIFCEVAPRPPHALWYEVFDVVYPETDSGPRLVAKGMNESVPAGHHTLPGYGSSWNL